MQNRKDSSLDVSLIPDEQTGLLTQSSSTKCSKIIKGVLMTIGSFAGVLYWEPGKKCAELDSCGKWLSDAITHDGAHAVFFLSGLDFALINVFMAGQSIEVFQNYMNKQSSTLNKVVKGTLIFTYAASQNFSMFLSSIGTGATGIKTALTVMGGAPGAVYGAVNMAENEIPRAISAINHAFMNLYNRCRREPLTVVEQHIQARLAHYVEQRNLFVNQVKANWKDILGNVKDIKIENYQTPLQFLFNKSGIAPHSEYTITKRLRNLFQISGAFLSANMVLPILLNLNHVLNKFIPSPVLSGVSTGFLGSSLIYGNMKITIGGMESIFDIMKNILTCQTIESVSYQVSKLKTLLALTGSVAMSALSYSVIALMWEQDYQGPAKEELGYSAKAAINIYHLFGLMHLYHLVFTYLAKDSKTQYLFNIEKEVERLTRITTEDFIQLIETKLTPEEKVKYGINQFSEKAPAEMKPINPSKNIQHKDASTGGFFSFFRFGKKPVEEVVDAEVEYENLNKV